MSVDLAASRAAPPDGTPARGPAAPRDALTLLLEPAAHERVRAFLEPRAEAIDAGRAEIKEALAYLNDELLAGAAGALGPNTDLTRVAQTIATAAWSDMSVAFSLWCHRMVLEYLGGVPGAPSESPLRHELLPRLLRTELLGSTALAAAMAHCVCGAPLTVEWRRDGDAVVLNGRVTWASNLFPPEFLMVAGAAPAAGGPSIVVAIRGGAPGVEIHPYPRLLALQSTGSSSLTLHDVRVPETEIVSEELSGFVRSVRPVFLLLQSSFCWGLAWRALQEARAGVRGVNEVFTDELRALEARALALATTIRTAATDRGATLPVRRLVETRLEAAQLTTAAVALEAKVAGGRGYVTSSATARRLREAAFLPIQAPTEGLLRWELSRSA